MIRPGTGFPCSPQEGRSRRWRTTKPPGTIQPTFVARRGSRSRPGAVDQVGDNVTDRLEVAVGSDLQYIRMNGTIVGACVGCVIFLLSWFVLRGEGASAG